MAHNITSRDTVIAVRDAGWHGLAEVQADYLNPEDARLKAFPWEPVTTPLYRAVPVVNDDGTLSTTYETVKGTVGIERSDTGEFFGAVGEDYTTVTNKTLTEIAEAVEGIAAGEVKVETAGSLKGGRKVWMLLRLAEPITVKGDNGPTIPYFALQNAHDGSGALRGQALFTKIICDNTAQAADLEARKNGTEFVFHHTSGIKDRIEEAKSAVAGWRASIEAWNQLTAMLIDIPVSPAGRLAFRDEFIPMPASKHMISTRVLNNIETARTEFDAIMASVTMQGIEGNAYGLVQAAIEFQQHARGVRAATDLARAESRFKRAYLDRDNLTTVAVQLAQDAALVN